MGENKTHSSSNPATTFDAGTTGKGKGRIDNSSNLVSQEKNNGGVAEASNDVNEE